MVQKSRQKNYVTKRWRTFIPEYDPSNAPLIQFSRSEDELRLCRLGKFLSFYQGYKGFVVTNVCHHWFKSCFDLRKKRMFSERFYLNSGIEHQTCRSIPQGTILGLLLFLKSSYERPAKLSLLQYVQNRTYVPTIRHEHSASNMCARFQFVHTWSVYRSSAEFSSYVNINPAVKLSRMKN